MAYNRGPPSGPRGWQQQSDQEAYRRRSPPRYGPHGSYTPTEQSPTFAQRPNLPPQAPRGQDYYSQRPSMPPHAPRNAFGVPQSPRNADFGVAPPRQPRHDDGYRQPYHDRPDYDAREPPAKRFRPASYEPPRVTADTYRPHTDGPIERSSYRMPEPRAAFPPQGIPYESRRPPYQHPDRYAHLMGESAMPESRQHYEMPRYPAQRPYEGQHAMPYTAHDRSRTSSGGGQWQQPRMPPSPRSSGAFGGWHPGAGGPMPQYPDMPPPRSFLPPAVAPQGMQPHSDRAAGIDAATAMYDTRSGPSRREDRTEAYAGPDRKEQESDRGALEQSELRPVETQLSERSASPPSTAMALREPSPEPTLSPDRSPTPVVVQQDFDVVLRAVADDPKNQRLLEELLPKQKQLVTNPVDRKAIKDITNLATHKSDLWVHSQLRGELEKTFRAAAAFRKEHIERVCSEYRDRNEMWKKHCERLDKLQAAEAAAIAAAQARADMAPMHTPVLPPLSARSSSRRGTGFFGDAVRSEAEFQELLASLEAEEMTDPNLRATRTAATVPDMLLPNDPERKLAMLDLDSTLVVDPVTFFQLEPGREVEQWTQDEQSIFCKRFALHPKIFGKIAAGLPGRSTSDCVRFYYHNKYRINFRSLLDKRAKRRNRGIRKGASSLLSNLVSNKGDEGEEEPPEAATPDLNLASTVPIRDRHHSAGGGDSRPGLSRLSTSQKKAARFALPLASVMSGEENPSRARVKSMPSLSTSQSGGEGLLPPLSLNTPTGPSLGYFDEAKQPSSRR